MSDMDLNTRNKNSSQNNGSSQDLKDQVADAGAEIKQRAGDVLRASTDTAREKFKEAADAAKDAAAGAADRFQDQAREQQRSGADFVGRFAGNIRDAARAFENDVPFAARGINSAAQYVDEAAEKIRNGSFRDLVDGATDFAKRQPAAFLGLSVLAGFAAVRFLKASGSQSTSGQDVSSPYPSSYNPSNFNPSSSYSSGSSKGEAS
jgi:gas vesicle protein